jgi:hypothetical protein
MQTKTTFKFLGATLMSLMLVACGGGDGSALDNTLNGISSSSSGGSSIAAKNWRIGSGTGSAFISGTIGTSSVDTLFEGDTVQLNVSIVDDQGVLTSEIKEVLFDSPCIASGLSTIAGGNKVNTINGTANIQYKVGKCDIDDKVTATAANGSATLEASVSLPINTRRIGSGFGSDFSNGALEIGIGDTTLSAGGSTSVIAYIVNTNGDLVTDPMEVTFSSPCLSSGNAAITDGNVVTSSAGKALATYTSKGCIGAGGADAIKATTTFRGNVLTASGYIFVKPDSPQTITFISAAPELVSLKGTGGLETSVLRFQVLGQAGNPVKGACVNFSLSTPVGGLALVPSKCSASGPETYGSSTDANGFASTIVQAGTVATAVRVTATIDGISTQSNALAVTTGIPDQNSTSLSLSDFSPISWEYDGVQSTATIRLADAFNNPAPNGTAVTFTTSGGAIDGSCLTSNGACTVEWRSQNPRPRPSATFSFSNITASGYTLTCSDGSKNCRSGRVKILATAIGNESFIDGNGTGLYDDTTKDLFAASNSSKCTPSVPNSSASVGVENGCDDLSEAYLDKNFNGVRDPDEEYIDSVASDDPAFNLGNGKYDGALCTVIEMNKGNCTQNKVTVRDDIVLTMASEKPLLVGLRAFTLSAGAAQLEIPVLLADINGNGMPKGTTVGVNSSNLVNATASLSISGALPMSTEPTTFLLFVNPDATKAPSGTVAINVTFNNVTTSFTVKVN